MRSNRKVGAGPRNGGDVLIASGRPRTTAANDDRLEIPVEAGPGKLKPGLY